MKFLGAIVKGGLVLLFAPMIALLKLGFLIWIALGVTFLALAGLFSLLSFL